uniref:Uncharacterized protein n=1 Tax=Octopus bimaculoides TaxID=37653 RepID=A0A0L8I2J5_OCTBM
MAVVAGKKKVPSHPLILFHSTIREILFRLQYQRSDDISGLCVCVLVINASMYQKNNNNKKTVNTHTLSTKHVYLYRKFTNISAAGTKLFCNNTIRQEVI